MNKKFTVRRYFSTYFEQEVEARDKEHALEVAGDPYKQIESDDMDAYQELGWNAERWPEADQVEEE